MCVYATYRGCFCLPGSVMRGVSGGQIDTTCLLDPDPTRQTVSLQMCGNGIVETGEDCDPGKGTTSNCCDVNTCKFINNAKCDPDSSPCCTAQCTFSPATQVCRPSKDQSCDSAEFCTGNNSTCPSDVVAPNGMPDALYLGLLTIYGTYAQLSQ